MAFSKLISKEVAPVDQTQVMKLKVPSSFCRLQKSQAADVVAVHLADRP